MKSLNLIGKTIKEVEDFIFSILYQNSKENLIFETGEYGMVFFQKLVNQWVEQSGFIRIETYKSELDKFKEDKFVKYIIANGRELLLLHNSELDLRKGQEIDEETGFPIKSSTLYLKEN